LSRPVRFVHAADLHLGAPLKRLDVGDAAVRARLTGATGTALDAVVDVCLERDVDFLAIAGDIYHDDSPSLADRARFQKAMRRLDGAGIPVFLVRGNHDAGDALRLDLDLPGNVRVFSADSVERLEVTDDGAVVAAVYGISYRQRSERRNLASMFERSGDEPIAVGVVHTSVAGIEDEADYAPCGPDDLRAANMDYWALGHIHKPQVVIDGYPLAAYAGSPQGLTPNETGVHGCRYVEIDGDSCTADLVACAAFEWVRVEVDVSRCASLDGVRRIVAQALSERPAEPPIVVRVGLTGSSPAHRELARAGSEALTELLRDDLGSAAGVAWLDRVDDRTTRTLDAAALSSEEGLVGDVVRSADAAVADPDAAEELLDTHLDALLRAVPGVTDEDRAALDPARIIALARDVALDRLLPEVGE
jgi:DNA repair exonuclease SbcCD nuclease subunit